MIVTLGTAMPKGWSMWWTEVIRNNMGALLRLWFHATFLDLMTISTCKTVMSFQVIKLVWRRKQRDISLHSRTDNLKKKQAKKLENPNEYYIYSCINFTKSPRNWFIFLRVFWPGSFSRKMFLPIHVAVKFDNAVIFALQVWFIKRIKPRLKVQILKFGEQENR